MYGNADLLFIVSAAVVVQQPAVSIPNGIGFIYGAGIPFLSGLYNRIIRVSFPVVYSVPGAGHSDLCVINVFKPDIKHQVVVLSPDHLAGGHLILLPKIIFIITEDGIP